MRLKRRPPAPSQPTPKVAFEDPFGRNPVDNEALLTSMGVDMLSGQLRTSIEKVGEAMRPVMAKRIITETLTDWYTFSYTNGSEQLTRVGDFVSKLIPEEVIAPAEALLDDSEYRFNLGYHRQLLEASGGQEGRDLAVKQGLENIGNFVLGAYASSCTEEVRDEFVTRFEGWMAETP